MLFAHGRSFLVLCFLLKRHLLHALCSFLSAVFCVRIDTFSLVIYLRLCFVLVLTFILYKLNKIG
jgi:hypothetical protein